MERQVPWFPDFVAAVELARRQTQTADRADPVGHYLTALSDGTVDELRTTWPRAIVVHDPRAGDVTKRSQLRAFVRSNRDWLAERRAHTERVSAACIDGRAAVEILAHLTGPTDSGGSESREIAWPVAVVAEYPEEGAVEFRTYCSQVPVDGRRHVRGPILAAGVDEPPAVVAEYLTAAALGDVARVLRTFAPDGYVREAIGPASVHRSTPELDSYFTWILGQGGVEWQCCRVTDDGVLCAVEYTCLSWGRGSFAPQAGVAFFERAADGRLAALRIYDDVSPPEGIGPAPRG
jgi:hypothetical protein